MASASAPQTHDEVEATFGNGRLFIPTRNPLITLNFRFALSRFHTRRALIPYAVLAHS